MDYGNNILDDVTWYERRENTQNIIQQLVSKQFTDKPEFVVNNVARWCCPVLAKQFMNLLNSAILLQDNIFMSRSFRVDFFGSSSMHIFCKVVRQLSLYNSASSPPSHSMYLISCFQDNDILFTRSSSSGLIVPLDSFHTAVHTRSIVCLFVCLFGV